MHDVTGSSSPRVRPRVWVGVLAFLAYLAVGYTIWIINGIDYARVAESEQTLLSWYVVPLTGGLIVTLVVVTVFGWWRPSLREERRLPRLAWVPSVMAAVAVLNLLFGDHSRVTPTMWLLLVVGSVLVGFNEEMIARGQLLVALRSRFGETGVWFFSTLLFSLLHLPNAFLASARSRSCRSSSSSAWDRCTPWLAASAGLSCRRWSCTDYGTSPSSPPRRPTRGLRLR